MRSILNLFMCVCVNGETFSNFTIFFRAETHSASILLNFQLLRFLTCATCTQVLAPYHPSPRSLIYYPRWLIFFPESFLLTLNFTLFFISFHISFLFSFLKVHRIHASKLIQSACVTVRQHALWSTPPWVLIKNQKDTGYTNVEVEQVEKPVPFHELTNNIANYFLLNTYI